MSTQNIEMEEIKRKDAKRDQLLWFVRTKMELRVVEDDETRATLQEKIANFFQGKPPNTIQVPVILSGTGKKRYIEATSDRTKWPGNPQITNNGYDEHGNEYWVGVYFGGPTATGNTAGASAGKGDLVERFSINGVGQQLRVNKSSVIRGRFVNLIKSLKEYNIPPTETNNIGIQETPRDDTGEAMLAERQRFGLQVLGFAGPTGATMAIETEQVVLPNRTMVKSMGIEYKEEPLAEGVRKSMETYRAIMYDAKKAEKQAARRYIQREMEERNMYKMAEGLGIIGTG